MRTPQVRSCSTSKNSGNRKIKGFVTRAMVKAMYTCKVLSSEGCALDDKLVSPWVQSSRHWLDCKEDFLLWSRHQKDPTNTWEKKIHRLETKEQSRFENRIWTRPCLVALAVSSSIGGVLRFWKMFQTPGEMKINLLLVVQLALKLRSTKIAGNSGWLNLSKKRKGERGRRRLDALPHGGAMLKEQRICSPSRRHNC